MRETSHPIAAPVRGSCRSVSSLAALPRPFARTALSQPSEIIPGGDNNYLFDPKTDSSLRFRAPACAPFGFGLRRRFPSSSALRCIPARPPKFLTELSRRVVLITSRFVCDSCSFHHDSSAKLVLAHLHHSYPTIRVLGPRSSRLRRSCWS